MQSERSVPRLLTKRNPTRTDNAGVQECYDTPFDEHQLEVTAAACTSQQRIRDFPPNLFVMCLCQLLPGVFP